MASPFSLISDPYAEEKEPTHKTYLEWLKEELGESNPALSPLSKVEDANPEDPHGEYVKKYGQYLTNTFLDSGEYNENLTPLDIRNAQIGLLQRRGVLSETALEQPSEEDIDAFNALNLYGAKEKDFDDITDDVLSFTGRDIGESFRDAASVYNGYRQEGLLDTEQGIAAREQFEAELSNLENRNALNRAMVSQRLDDSIGGVAFAEVKTVDEEGEEQVDFVLPKVSPRGPA